MALAVLVDPVLEAHELHGGCGRVGRRESLEVHPRRVLLVGVLGKVVGRRASDGPEANVDLHLVRGGERADEAFPMRAVSIVA